MRAASPATRTAFTAVELVYGDHDAAGSCLGLFGTCDPANKFVTREGRDIIPGGLGFAIGAERVAKVIRHTMRCLGGENWCTHIPIVYS